MWGKCSGLIQVCFASARGDCIALEALLWRGDCEAEAVVDLKFRSPDTNVHRGYAALHWAAENGYCQYRAADEANGHLQTC